MLLVRSLCRRTPSLSTSTTALVSRAASRIQSPSTSLVAQLLSRPELPSTSKRFQSNSAKTVTVYFVDRDGEKITAKAKLGQSLLDVAIDNNIDLEGFGACEGTLSCSTCHLILKKENYDKLKPPTDEENDMLDLAFGLTETSRLGCQIIVDDKMNEWTFVVPKEVSDARK